MKEEVNWCKLHSCLILRNCHQPSVPTTLISLWLTTLRQNPPPSKKTTAHWRLLGFPVALVVKNSPASAGDPRDAGSTPGSGRPPGGENGNPLKFLPGKFHGQRSLTGYGTWGGKKPDMTKWLSTHRLRWVFLLNIYTFLDTMLLHT